MQEPTAEQFAELKNLVDKLSYQLDKLRDSHRELEQQHNQTRSQLATASKSLAAIEEAARDATSALIGDLSGRVGLIQSDKHTQEKLEALRGAVHGEDGAIKRIESLEHQAWRNVGFATAAGLGAGLVVDRLKDAFK